MNINDTTLVEGIPITRIAAHVAFCKECSELNRKSPKSIKLVVDLLDHAIKFEQRITPTT